MSTACKQRHAASVPTFYRRATRPICERESDISPRMPRLVRRKPFLERVKDSFNLGDFLLWLSEEFETRDWDSKQFATPLALGLHVVLLIARANSGSSSNSNGDDVFGDDHSGTGWFSYIVRTLTDLSELCLLATGHIHCTSPHLLLRCQCRLYFLS